MPVELGRDTPRREPEGARRDDERSIGVREGVGEDLDGLAVGLGGGEKVTGKGEFVLEGEVDHTVGLTRGGSQRLEVVERAASNVHAGRLQRGGRLVGSGETDHVVTGVAQFRDYGRADPAGRASDKRSSYFLQRGAHSPNVRRGDDIR